MSHMKLTINDEKFLSAIDLAGDHNVEAGMNEQVWCQMTEAERQAYIDRFTHETPASLAEKIKQQAAEIERLRTGLDDARHQLAWAARKLKDAGVSDSSTDLAAGNAARILEETRDD